MTDSSATPFKGPSSGNASQRWESCTNFCGLLNYKRLKYGCGYFHTFFQTNKKKNLEAFYFFGGKTY